MFYRNIGILVLGMIGGLLNNLPIITDDQSIIITGYFLWGLFFLGIVNVYFSRSNMQKMAKSIGLVGGVLFALEILGAQTGMIYGDFIYHSDIILQILGTPIVMIGIWGFLIHECYQLVRITTTQRSWFIIPLTAASLVIFDLVIDPGAAHLGLWTWISSGNWFNIPFSNFIGWFIMGSIGSFCIYIKNGTIKDILYTPTVLLLSLGFWGTYHLTKAYFILGIISMTLALAIIWVYKKQD